MTLTRKIVFLIAIIVGLFITLNLTVLPFVTRNYFFDFLQQFYTESRENQLDADILNLIKKFPNQAPELLEQYRDIDSDLNKLVSGFEEYINTDPVFNRDSVSAALKDSWVAEKQIDEVIGLNAMSVFLKTAPFWFDFTGENDPKKAFINQVLSVMLFINIWFVALLSVFVLYFLRRSFQPIRTITNTLDSFTAASGNLLEYGRNDEFRPLIDSLNNLRLRLDHQEQIRAQFLTDMSHELKTPMTAIGVYLEGIQDGVIQLNTKNINALTSELSRLTRIVESLMHFQMFESRPTVFRYEKISLYEIFTLIQETHSQELNRHLQTMNYAGSKRASIVFDRDNLIQIFHNVVANFLRYAWSGSQLRINFLEEGNTNILIFQDNGVGVTIEDLPYLKEKFYQVDKSKTGDVKDRGLGVGLSIIDKIVRDAGGFVDLISAPWDGFTVRIELPKREL